MFARKVGIIPTKKARLVAVPPKTLEAILADIGAGTAVHQSLSEHGINRRDFYALLAADESVANRYARAKDQGCEAYADESIELADEEPPMVDTANGKHMDAAFVAWQKLRIETRKWHLAKLRPKKYGDRVLLGGDPDNPIPPLVLIGAGKPPRGSSGAAGNTD